MSKRFCAGLITICLTVAGAKVEADTVLNSVARGHYNQAGLHSSGDNYIAGQVNADTLHDFFTFDLSGIVGQITSAKLVLFNPPNGANGAGTYTVYDVTTDAASLNSERFVGGTGASAPSTAIYTDLGTMSGGAPVYGSVTYSHSNLSQTYTINLGPQFLSDANNRTSNLFSVGGAADNGNFLYGFSGSGHPNDGLTQLDVTVAPLPSAASGAIFLVLTIGLMKLRKLGGTLI
jgi:hypothetical protein